MWLFHERSARRIRGNKNMYRIDYTDLRNAAEIIYYFMTIPVLTNPECTVWTESDFPHMFTNDGTGCMTEREFCRKLLSSDFTAISCVASTDKRDERRVVLHLMPDMGYLVLNFPSANGKLNEAEKRLLKLLEI